MSNLGESPQGTSIHLGSVLRKLDGLQLALSMTLVLLVVAGPSYWYARIPIAVVAILALLLPGLRTSPTLWLVLATIVVSTNVRNWYVLDNHKHLLGCWCAAIWLALDGDKPAEILSRNARWLLVLVFGFATLWKIISPEFISGGFFEFSLLFDHRFRDLVLGLELLTPTQVLENTQAFQKVNSALDQETSATVVQSASIASIGRWMAIWTVLIEGFVAMAFLLRFRWLPRWPGHAALLVFVLSTYLLAPVIGFGYILLALGMSDTKDSDNWWRAAYLGAFAILQIYTAPWGHLWRNQ